MRYYCFGRADSKSDCKYGRHLFAYALPHSHHKRWCQRRPRAMNKQDIEPVIVHEEDCEVESWSDEVKGYVEWRTLISGDRTRTHSLTSGVAEIPVGVSNDYRMHRHSPVEMYYILEGSGSIKIVDDEFGVRKGSTVFIPGNVAHCLINTGDVPLRLLYVFSADSFDEIEYEFP